jgi:copper chaperone NosL
MQMPKSARLLVALAALLLMAVYAFPLWRIGLVAPQYPEGLGMRIHVNDVRGATEHDLNNINGLNHYIGMKVIEPDAIPELRFMPWIVAGLIVGAAAIALAGRPKPLYAYAGVFGVTGVAGIVDFWKWQYDYGHNLDEATAIIKIPGMSYQPPLIGSKQLLNFTATSWPDVGGIAIGVALACVAVAVWLTIRSTRAARRTSAAAALAMGSLACAPSDAREIHYGVETCAYCHMVVSDERHAAQLVTGKGRVEVFDSIECLASYVIALGDDEQPHALWVSDFEHPGTFIPAEGARYVHGGSVRSPMGLGLTAFSSGSTGIGVAGGEQLDWAGVIELVKADAGRRGERGVGPRST